MAFKPDFGITKETLTAFATEFGTAVSPSDNAPGTTTPYTDLQIKQAIARAVNYIVLRYFNNFNSKYKSTTVAGLIEEVRCSLVESIHIVAIEELANPHGYTLTINPLENREIIKVKDVEWRPNTHATTAERLTDSQTHNVQVHLLLDRYTISAGKKGNLGVFIPKG